MASLAKDFHRLMKRIDRLSDRQARIEDINWEDDTLDRFTVVIKPNASYYEGGTFRFRVTVPETYPSEMAPAIWCETDIYHPNIDPTDDAYDDMSTNVCCNLFDTGTWNPKFGLEGVVLGLIFLMHNPNYDDPLSPYFDREPCPDEAKFVANVRRYMTGQDVDDNTFKIDFALPDKDTSVVIDQHDANIEDKTEDVDTLVSDATNGSLNVNTENNSDRTEVNVNAEADTEVTEEMMLKLLTERDNIIYVDHVDKSVAEMNEACSLNVNTENNPDGTEVNVNAEAETEVTEEMMLKLLTERDNTIYVDHVVKSVAEMNEACSLNVNTENNPDGTEVNVNAEAETEVTEEMMLKLLNERDNNIYVDHVYKSVAEMNEECAAMNNIQGHTNNVDLVGHDNDGENCDGDDIIDMLFVDGDFVLVHADCNSMSNEAATETESNAHGNVNVFATSVIATDDTVAQTADDMIQHIAEEGVLTCTKDNNSKDPAELNEEDTHEITSRNEGATFQTSHNDMEQSERTSETGVFETDVDVAFNNANEPATASGTDKCNVDTEKVQTPVEDSVNELAGATHDGNKISAEDGGQTRTLSKPFQRSVSAPQGYSGGRDTSYFRANNHRVDNVVDACLNTFTYLIIRYNKSY